MTELSPEEAAVVARFDAADSAPESLRERVAEAMKMWDGTTSSDSAQEWFLGLADAAIAVMRGQA